MENAFDNLKGVNPPFLFISELNRTSAILRDILSVSFNSITVDNETFFREIKDYISTIAPEKESIVKLHKVMYRYLNTSELRNRSNLPSVKRSPLRTGIPDH